MKGKTKAVNPMSEAKEAALYVALVVGVLLACGGSSSGVSNVPNDGRQTVLGWFDDMEQSWLVECETGRTERPHLRRGAACAHVARQIWEKEPRYNPKGDPAVRVRVKTWMYEYYAKSCEYGGFHGCRTFLRLGEDYGAGDGSGRERRAELKALPKALVDRMRNKARELCVAGKPSRMSWEGPMIPSPDARGELCWRAGNLLIATGDKRGARIALDWACESANHAEACWTREKVFQVAYDETARDARAQRAQLAHDERAELAAAERAADRREQERLEADRDRRSQENWDRAMRELSKLTPRDPVSVSMAPPPEPAKPAPHPGVRPSASLPPPNESVAVGEQPPAPPPSASPAPAAPPSPPVKNQEKDGDGVECNWGKGCLHVVAPTSSDSNYCQVNNKGKKDYLPTLRNICNKKVSCKACAVAGDGSLFDCKEWTFAQGQSIGGWASPFNWCDASGVQYVCVDAKSPDQCLDQWP